MSEQANTYMVPLDCWADFTGNLAKFNRKATKLGCEPIRVEIVNENVAVERVFMTVDEDHAESTRIVEVLANEVRLVGTAPKLADWSLVARVEGIENEILIHHVPGFEGTVDARFRDLGAEVCEHCNLTRKRNDTFIVEHVDGTQTQVGRNCLRDFTGHSPERELLVAKWLFSVRSMMEESERSFWGKIEHYINVPEALALASYYVSKYGYVSKSKAEAENNYPTALRVADHWQRSTSDSAREEKKYAIDGIKDDPMHKQRADEVVQWVRNVLANKPNLNDYERNLVVLFKVTAVSPFHLGLCVSAMAAYLRWQEREVEKRERKICNEWVGKVGERLRGLTVTVETMRMLETAWGASTLIKFRDDAGHVFTWFASGDREREYKIGEKTIITGSVKAHNEYKGAKETLLTRVS